MKRVNRSPPQLLSSDWDWDWEWDWESRIENRNSPSADSKMPGATHHPITFKAEGGG